MRITERFLLQQAAASHHEREAVMPEEIEAPKIRIVLKAGQKPDPEAPPLRFMRWKLASGEGSP